MIKLRENIAKRLAIFLLFGRSTSNSFQIHLRCRHKVLHPVATSNRPITCQCIDFCKFFERTEDAIILLVGQAFLKMKCRNPINVNLKALL